jgi:hypothetical protein
LDGVYFMETLMPLNNLDALQQIHDLLAEKNVSWLVGGSCGLLLQGVTITEPPRDLDLYVDMETATGVNEALQMYATDQLQQSQTGIYKSLLSHYQVANVSIEVVGGFEVHAQNSHYKVEVDDFLDAFGVSYKLKDKHIGLMPLAHELVFNILRQRPDRYMAIAEKIRMNPAEYLTPLNKILERNTFSAEFLKMLTEML